MSFSHRAQIPGSRILTTLLALHASRISAESCYNPTNHSDFNNMQLPILNATGSVSFPGFAYPGESTSNWTLSTGVYFDNTSRPGKAGTAQAFWLDTNPIQNLSSSDLPYYGCAVKLYTPYEKEVISKGSAKDNNTCDGVLSSKCYDYLIETAHNQAQDLIGSNKTDTMCPSIMHALSSGLQDNCKGQIDAITTNGGKNSLPQQSNLF
jgi:hypothetical protein